jgi:hypothetical protein
MKQRRLTHEKQAAEQALRLKRTRLTGKSARRCGFDVENTVFLNLFIQIQII